MVRTLAVYEKIRYDLETCIEKYNITIEFISATTNIPVNIINSFLDNPSKLDIIEMDDLVFLYNLLNSLNYSIAVDFDDRLKCMTKLFIEGFCLSIDTISMYSGVPSEAIEQFLSTGVEANYEYKYKLAMVVLSLRKTITMPVQAHQEYQMAKAIERLNL